MASNAQEIKGDDRCDKIKTDSIFYLNQDITKSDKMDNDHEFLESLQSKNNWLAKSLFLNITEGAAQNTNIVKFSKGAVMKDEFSATSIVGRDAYLTACLLQTRKLLTAAGIPKGTKCTVTGVDADISDGLANKGDPLSCTYHFNKDCPFENIYCSTGMATVLSHPLAVKNVTSNLGRFKVFYPGTAISSLPAINTSNAKPSNTSTDDKSFEKPARDKSRTGSIIK